MIKSINRRTTVKDIAQVADMSLSTVSGVLNGNGGFAETTRKKIWDIAHELNYVPNQEARTLRSGKNVVSRKETGIIIHVSHMGDYSPLGGNDFEARRSLMISWEAEKKGLFPISYWYHQNKGFRCPPVINGMLDGAIVGTPHLDVVRALTGKLPMVLMDVPFSSETADTPMVNIDFRHGFIQLYNYLKENGHRDIALVSPNGVADEITYDQHIQEMGMYAGMCGMNVKNEFAEDIKISPATHLKVMREISEKLAVSIRNKEITVVVCSGQAYTDTLFGIFEEMGIKIPEEVSLAGLYQQIPPADYPITSILYDWEKLVRTSLDVLHDLIKGCDLNCSEFLVQPTLFKGNTVRENKKL